MVRLARTASASRRSRRRRRRSSTRFTTPSACGWKIFHSPELGSWRPSRGRPDGGCAMKGFDLHEPTTVTQAVGLLDQLGPAGKVLAGGSDLVGGVMKDWITGKGMPLPS